MAETIEQKQERLAKLKAQEQALLEKAKTIKKRIARVESADKTKRRKQDDRTKLLLGVGLLEVVRQNPQMRNVLAEAVRKLSESDRQFIVNESALWAELAPLRAPQPSPAPQAADNSLQTRRQNLV